MMKMRNVSGKGGKDSAYRCPSCGSSNTLSRAQGTVRWCRKCGWAWQVTARLPEQRSKSVKRRKGK